MLRAIEAHHKRADGKRELPAGPCTPGGTATAAHEVIMSTICAHSAIPISNHRLRLYRRRSRPGIGWPFVEATAPDERARQVAVWWKRMHSYRRPLVACAVKLVDLQPAGPRTVWEVCKWPKAMGYDWCFICWELDGSHGVGAWWLTLPNKRAAMAVYRQPATVVMQRRNAPTTHAVFAPAGSSASSRT